MRTLPFSRLSLLVLTTLSLVLAGCGDDDDVTFVEIDNEPGIVDLVATLQANGFNTLAAAVEAAGLTATLQGDGPFTVFAPTDAAFAALPPGQLNALLQDPAALADILLYHVVPGQVLSTDLPGVPFADTVNGQPVLFDTSAGVRVNGVNVSQADVLATNGVAHAIDMVLLPPSMDIVDTAITAGFDTLVTAVQAAGLEATLRGPGPFTVFAPTNDAFDQLPPGALAMLLGDIPALTDVLLYHVVDGRVLSGSLTTGAVDTLLMGEQVQVTVNGTVMIDNAMVTQADILCTNGVVHVLDMVLLP